MLTLEQRRQPADPDACAAIILAWVDVLGGMEAGFAHIRATTGLWSPGRLMAGEAQIYLAMLRALPTQGVPCPIPSGG